MYCSIQDVRDRNQTILDDSYINDDRVFKCIESAQCLVDGMLGKRYSVPFFPAPSMIREITADLSASQALALVVGNRGDNRSPVQAKELYDKALSLLQKISIGEICIGGCAQKCIMKSSDYNRQTVFGKADFADSDTFSSD